MPDFMDDGARIPRPRPTTGRQPSIGVKGAARHRKVLAGTVAGCLEHRRDRACRERRAQAPLPVDTGSSEPVPEAAGPRARLPADRRGEDGDAGDRRANHAPARRLRSGPGGGASRSRSGGLTRRRRTLTLRPRQALLTLPGRSPDLTVCPFLRAGAGTDVPPDAAAAGHRCLAVLPAVAVGDRQRQLLCRGCQPCRPVRAMSAARPGCERRSRRASDSAGARLRSPSAPPPSCSSPRPPWPSPAGSDPSVAMWQAGGAAATPSSAATSRATAAPVEGGSAPSGSPGATEPCRPSLRVATVRPTLVATADLPAPWRGLEPCPAPDSLLPLRRPATRHVQRHRRPLRDHGQEAAPAQSRARRTRARSGSAPRCGCHRPPPDRARGRSPSRRPGRTPGSRRAGRLALTALRASASGRLPSRSVPASAPCKNGLDGGPARCKMPATWHKVARSGDQG